MSKFTLGCDPELMVARRTGELISAVPLIPEGKGMGHEIKGAPGNQVLHDNVMIEFNTIPTTTEAGFISNLRRVLKGIQEKIGEELKLKLQASAYYPETELQSHDAQQFGCEPDFCAWFLKINDPAQPHENLRSAGGHLHIGGVSQDKVLQKILDDPLGKIAVVRALDIFCGLAWTFLDKDPTAKDRRLLYGGAGAHRPKNYGVEYRTLSNCWLRSPLHVRLTYKLVRDALDFVKIHSLPEEYLQWSNEEVIQAINRAEKKRAATLFAKICWPCLSKDTKRLVRQVDQDKNTRFIENW